MKVGIITIVDNNNYGNRLQSYAVQKILKKMGIESETIYYGNGLNIKQKSYFKIFKNILKEYYIEFKLKLKNLSNHERE